MSERDIRQQVVRASAVQTRKTGGLGRVLFCSSGVSGAGVLADLDPEERAAIRRANFLHVYSEFEISH